MPVTKLDWRKIDLKKHLRYAATPLKGGSHDGYTVPLKIYDPDTQDEHALLIQGPEMRLPFGIQEKEIANKIAYRCQLSFPGVTFSPSAQTWMGPEENVTFLQWIQNLDQTNKTAVMDNHQTWFKKKPQSREVQDAFYFDNVYMGEKVLTGDYSPTLSAKLRVSRDGKILTQLFNEKMKPMSYDEISGDAGKGLRVVPLLRTSGLWFAGKNNGMALQIEQLLVYRREELHGCAIEVPGLSEACAEDDDDDDSQASGDYPGAPAEPVAPAFNLRDDPAASKKRRAAAAAEDSETKVRRVAANA